VVISAAYIERVTAFETEHDSILIVHAHGVQPSHATDLSRSSRSASGMLRFGMRPV
jgi:ribosomal protein L10